MDKSRFIKKTVAISDVVNANGRMYSYDTLKKVVHDFNNSNSPMYGELLINGDNPSQIKSTMLDLSNVSHYVKSLNIKPYYGLGDSFYALVYNGVYELEADIVILDNEVGEMAFGMANELSLSLCGRGKMSMLCYMDPKTSIYEGEYLGQLVEEYKLESISLIMKSEDSFGMYKYM